MHSAWTLKSGGGRVGDQVSAPVWGSSLPALFAHRADIDGLRAVAVLLVVLFHFGLPPALSAGFIGVDIFFVISGFLIIPSMIDRMEAKRFDFRDFYERRVRRL